MSKKSHSNSAHKTNNRNINSKNQEEYQFFNATSASRINKSTQCTGCFVTPNYQLKSILPSNRTGLRCFFPLRPPILPSDRAETQQVVKTLHLILRSVGLVQDATQFLFTSWVDIFSTLQTQTSQTNLHPPNIPQKPIGRISIEKKKVPGASRVLPSSIKVMGSTILRSPNRVRVRRLGSVPTVGLIQNVIQQTNPPGILR